MRSAKLEAGLRNVQEIRANDDLRAIFWTALAIAERVGTWQGGD